MAEIPEGKPQKAIQRGKGKALNALAAASGRDPALIAKEVAKAAALKEEEERLKRLEQSRAHSTPAGIYKSLSQEDQYRFECFRRCAFPSGPIEKFVAKTMIDEAYKRSLVRRGVMAGLGVPAHGTTDNLKSIDRENKSSATEVTDASSISDESRQKKKRRKRTKKSLLNEESKRRQAVMDQPLPYVPGSSQQHAPPLDSLVVPDSASEIVAVVSTLAKCYAQRLVAAARRVADAEEEATKFESTEDDGVEKDEKNKDAVSTAKSIKPLQPHHYMEAHRHRMAAGIDPGFWMTDMINKQRSQHVCNNSAGVAKAAAIGRDNWNSAHLAALAAQDEYDEMVQKNSQEKTEKEEHKMDVEAEEEQKTD